MRDIKLDELEHTIATPSCVPKSGARLAIAERPEPFVAPTLRLLSSDSPDPFFVEVVFVQASAAVGKSVIAEYLSSSRQAPLLNLAEVPVSTHSLMGLIQSDLSGVEDPVQAFHTGTLPIIIDALDEGRLLSGEQGFERFLETTGELLLRDRSVMNRPKIVLFGRHDSTELAMVGLQLSGAGLRTCSVEIGFFDEKAAWEMIDVYARSSATPDASYMHHPEPVHKLISAYFSAIEAAVGLDQGKLWTDERGRAFAGYAPVLAAVGSLLAGMDNFKDVANRLRAGGTQEAWGVIETVLQEILDREQHKLRDKLTQHVQAPVPNEAYDAHEQLTFLTRFVHGQALAGSGRVRFPDTDQARYFSMVEQYLPEHPFIRQGKLSNAVLGSLVLAHAVSNDLLRDTDLQVLENLSRQPFLWRSLRRQLTGGVSLIDGRYLGCALNSFWNDPITRDPYVVIRSTGDDGSANLQVVGDTKGELIFEVTLPLTLYGQIRDCDIDVRETVTLKGRARRESPSAFYVHGATTIVCDAMDIIADSITLGGKVWFEAAQVTWPARLNLHLKNGAEVGWAGQFAEQYPWTRFSSTLTAPYPVRSEDLLTSLIEECRARLPGGPLILSDDLSPVPNEPRMQWVARRFPNAFPRLLRVMVDHGLASTEPYKPSGTGRKIRMRFGVAWQELRNALQSPTTAPTNLREFLKEASRAVSE